MEFVKCKKWQVWCCDLALMGIAYIFYSLEFLHLLRWSVERSTGRVSLSRPMEMRAKEKGCNAVSVSLDDVLSSIQTPNPWKPMAEEHVIKFSKVPLLLVCTMVSLLCDREKERERHDWEAAVAVLERHVAETKAIVATSDKYWIHMERLQNVTALLKHVPARELNAMLQERPSLESSYNVAKEWFLRSSCVLEGFEHLSVCTNINVSSVFQTMNVITATEEQSEGYRLAYFLWLRLGLFYYSTEVLLREKPIATLRKSVYKTKHGRWPPRVLGGGFWEKFNVVAEVGAPEIIEDLTMRRLSPYVMSYLCTENIARVEESRVAFHNGDIGRIMDSVLSDEQRLLIAAVCGVKSNSSGWCYTQTFEHADDVRVLKRITGLPVCSVWKFGRSEVSVTKTGPNTYHYDIKGDQLPVSAMSPGSVIAGKGGEK